MFTVEYASAMLSVNVLSRLSEANTAFSSEKVKASAWREVEARLLTLLPSMYGLNLFPNTTRSAQAGH